MKKGYISPYGKRFSMASLERLVKASNKHQKDNLGLKVLLEVAPIDCAGPGLGFHVIYDGRSIYKAYSMLARLESGNCVALELDKAVTEILNGGGDDL